MGKLTRLQYFNENHYTHLIIASAVMFIYGVIATIMNDITNLVAVGFGLLIGLTVYWQGNRVYDRFYNKK